MNEFYIRQLRDFFDINIDEFEKLPVSFLRDLLYDCDKNHNRLDDLAAESSSYSDGYYDGYDAGHDSGYKAGYNDRCDEEDLV